MKNIYITPALDIIEAQAQQMLAESLIISNQTVDGGDALSKEDDSWDIWSE